MTDYIENSLARITVDQMHHAAFCDEEGYESTRHQLRELARILYALAAKIEEKADNEAMRANPEIYTEEDEAAEEYREGTLDIPLRDYNGNVAGRAIIALTERPG